jgi:hypothetical protein
MMAGRNRWLACRKLGIEPKCIEWDAPRGMNVGEFIIGLNASRRHLTQDQLGMSVGLAMQWISADRLAKRAAKQFKPGNAGGPGRGKTVRTDSCEPFPEPTRDHKAEHARSFVGQVAAAANTSHHKAG